jgi:hypothetical protein
MPTITVITRLKAGTFLSFSRGASASGDVMVSTNDNTQINNKNPHGPTSLNNAEPLRRSAPSTLRGWLQPRQSTARPNRRRLFAREPSETALKLDVHRLRFGGYAARAE